MATSSYESLNHAKWDCKYHVVFILKGRKTALYGKIRRCLGPVLRELAGQRGSTILAGPTVQDHVHRLMRIPPKGVRERAKPARVLSLLHECSLLR